jgi:hypothetical protein
MANGGSAMRHRSIVSNERKIEKSHHAKPINVKCRVTGSSRIEVTSDRQ